MSTKYDRTVSKDISKMAMRLTAQVKLLTSNSFSPILIHGLLKEFKLSCNNNGLHEGAAMWPAHSLRIRNCIRCAKCTSPCWSYRKEKGRWTDSNTRYFTALPQADNFFLKSMWPAESLQNLNPKFRASRNRQIWRLPSKLKNLRRRRFGVEMFTRCMPSTRSSLKVLTPQCTIVWVSTGRIRKMQACMTSHFT